MSRGLLLPLDKPLPGLPGGAPNLLLGATAPSPVGAPANLLYTPDKRGREWTMLVAEVSRDAIGMLTAAGRPAEPMWPILVRNQHGRVGWDGINPISDGRAVRIDTVTVTWLDDGDLIHVIALGRLPETTPERLLATLVSAGIVTGWADAAGHTRRWLEANLLAVAPHLQIPADAPDREVLGALCGWLGYSSIAAMQATGGYDPTPHVGPTGLVSLRRLRAAVPPATLTSGRAIHHIAPVFGGGGILDVLQSGALLSQRRRRLLGTPAGYGSRERQDRTSGKAGRVFLDVDDDPFSPPLALIWTDIPRRLMSRLDFAVAVEPMVPMPLGTVSDQPVELDPTGRAADASPVPPQVALASGVDLFGPHGPDCIAVRDDVEREDVLNVLRSRGIDRLGGTIVQDAVTSNPLGLRADAAV